jgi:hypothetical protein
MKKRFAVIVDSTTPEQAAALTEFFKENHVGWWHWLTNLWLVSDSSGKLSASGIRDTLGTIFPGVHCLVLEINDDGDTWSGFGPKTTEKNMFKWIRENW